MFYTLDGTNAFFFFQIHNTNIRDKVYFQSIDLINFVTDRDCINR